MPRKTKLETEADLAEYEANEIIQLVKNSEQISGVGFAGKIADWKRDHIIRHVEIAEILCKPHQYVSLGLINSCLSKRPNEWFRSGVDGAFKGMVPEGKDVESFADDIERYIRNGLDQFKNDCDDLKESFAREAHDRVICSHLFKGWNGRTARLLENHLRVLLGLPVLIIPYEESKEYFDRIEEYRRNSFLPRLRAFYAN